MAAIITGAVADLLGTSAASQIGRAVVGGLIGVEAGKLLNAIQTDLGSGNPASVATARRVPQYAIVDMHTNKTVRFLSTRKVYSILTHPSRRSNRGRGTAKVAILRAGEEMVSVR